MLRLGLISGLPGFITREADGELQTAAFNIRDGRICAIFVMRNPDKLNPVYCRLFGIAYEAVPLDEAMEIRVADYRRPAGAIIVPNPNAPTGGRAVTGWDRDAAGGTS